MKIQTELQSELEETQEAVSSLQLLQYTSIIIIIIYCSFVKHKMPLLIYKINWKQLKIKCTLLKRKWKLLQMNQGSELIIIVMVCVLGDLVVSVLCDLGIVTWLVNNRNTIKENQFNMGKQWRIQLMLNWRLRIKGMNYATPNRNYQH